MVASGVRFSYEWLWISQRPPQLLSKQSSQLSSLERGGLGGTVIDYFIEVKGE